MEGFAVEVFATSWIEIHHCNAAPEYHGTSRSLRPRGLKYGKVNLSFFPYASRSLRPRGLKYYDTMCLEDIKRRGLCDLVD